MVRTSGNYVMNHVVSKVIAWKLQSLPKSIFRILFMYMSATRSINENNFYLIKHIVICTKPLRQ